MRYLWKADLSKSFCRLRMSISQLNMSIFYLFSNFFFNRFCQVEKCGITPHCFYLILNISNDVKTVLITIKLISWTFFIFYFCSSRFLLLVREILMHHSFSSYIGRRNQKNIVKWVYFITIRKRQ